MKKLKSLILISIAAVLSISFIAYAKPVPSEATAPDAKALFDGTCAKCHGKDGRAKSWHAKHEHARDLTKADWQNDVSDERIFNSISNGKGKMPAFKKKLTDDQIDSLVTYVRHFRR